MPGNISLVGLQTVGPSGAEGTPRLSSVVFADHYIIVMDLSGNRAARLQTWNEEYSGSLFNFPCPCKLCRTCKHPSHRKPSIRGKTSLCHRYIHLNIKENAGNSTSRLQSTPLLEL